MEKILIAKSKNQTSHVFKRNKKNIIKTTESKKNLFNRVLFITFENVLGCYKISNAIEQ